MNDTRPDLPATFHFDIGGYNGGCHSVDLISGSLRIKHAPGAYAWNKETVVTPSPEAWTQFWQAVDAIGVWAWQEDYNDPDVLDGTGWTLEITHAGRQLKSGGSNAYPGGNGPSYGHTSAFAQFLRALRLLTGIKGIQ